MNLIIKENISSYKYRLIIGNKGHLPTSLSAEEIELFNAFLTTEEDFKSISSLDSTTFLVKTKDEREKMRAIGAKVRGLLDRKVTEIAIHSTEVFLYDVIEGVLLSNYQFNRYFKDKEEKANLLESIFVTSVANQDKLKELNSITKAVYWARDMVNEPLSFLTAEQLAEEIRLLGEETNMHITILEKSQIEALKMGGLLAVNKGSIDPPTFTIVEYKSAKATNKKPIVLVGKGVVYDTGGLSLKPTPNSMDIMKCDMGGAACVSGAIYLAALQQLPLHIIALIPATDNRPGLNAYVPGDVITMFDGTTVEVLNTDAEGRIILADALAYSKKFDPELVIDAATLTGSANAAIGIQASCIMGNADEKYFQQLEKAGEECYERVVKFPFWDEYFEDMKSSIADLKNIGGPTAGMITAGKFLEHFVEAPYIHMDIAGPAWLNTTSAYRTKGGSAYGVRLLYQFFKNYN